MSNVGKEAAAGAANVSGPDEKTKTGHSVAREEKPFSSCTLQASAGANENSRFSLKVLWGNTTSTCLALIQEYEEAIPVRSAVSSVGNNL